MAHALPRFAPRTPSQPIRGIAYGVFLSLIVWMMIALAILAL